MAKIWVPDATVFMPNNLITDEPPDPVWDGMSRLDFLHIGTWMRKLADSMGLRDWRLQLKWEPSEVGEDPDIGPTWARCQVMEQLTTTTIWVCEGYLGLHKAEKIRTMAHELIHAHLDTLYNIGDRTVQKYMGQGMYDLFSEEFHRTIEKITDLMAVAWSSTLEPMPSTISREGFVIRLQDGREMTLRDFLDQEYLEPKEL